MASAMPAYCDGEGMVEKPDPENEAKYAETLNVDTELEDKAAEAAKVASDCMLKKLAKLLFRVGKEVALTGGKKGKKIGDVGFCLWDHELNEVGWDKTPKAMKMMVKVCRGKCKFMAAKKDYKKLTTSTLKVMQRTAAYFSGASKGLGVGGVMMVKYPESKIGYFAVSGCPKAKNDIMIARETLLKVGMTEGSDGVFTAPPPEPPAPAPESMEGGPLPKIKGGYKKGTDVPLIPQPSSDEFKAKVAKLKEKLAAGDKTSILAVLKFAVFIFGMRHPNELRGLLDNLEAVFRAQAGAEDGSIDPEEDVTDKDKFAAISKRIESGDESAWYEVAVAAISLISIFHVDQLPVLMVISEALKDPSAPRPADTEFFKRQDALQSVQTKLDVVKAVTIWAVNAFSIFHPDVVIKMGLLANI